MAKRKSNRKPHSSKRQAGPTRASKQEEVGHLCEAEVAEGLEGIAADEMWRRFGARVRWQHPPTQPPEPGTLRFLFFGPLEALAALRTVLSVHLVQQFAVARPRALLGEENLRLIEAQIAAVRALAPPDAFSSLYLSAAGSESTIMTRLATELATRSGLLLDEVGDLLVRIRRPPGGEEGWEVLVRLTPRPLSARAWRVCNMEGALNATVAHAMLWLTEPTQGDVVLNLACGSGTLMVERLELGRVGRMMGCDTNPAALACARENLAASPRGSKGELFPWDARAVPLPDGSVQVLLADLPFGHLVGSHEENLSLYPAILAEAARLAVPGSPFVLISHELRLMESLVEASPHWRTQQQQRVTLGGLHPRIWHLVRR